jgi:hypothetical protein
LHQFLTATPDQDSAGDGENDHDDTDDRDAQGRRCPNSWAAACAGAIALPWRSITAASALKNEDEENYDQSGSDRHADPPKQPGQTLGFVHVEWCPSLNFVASVLLSANYLDVEIK